MKLTLIRARYEGTSNEPPLCLGYLAAVAEKAGHCVRIIDAEGEGLKISQVVTRLKKQAPDVVGITSMSYERHTAFKIAGIAKSLGAKVIMGGHHATFTPKDTLENNPKIDLIVVGEGEETLIETLNAFEKNESLNQIKGIAYRKNKKIIINEPREFIKDVNTIPIPAYHLFNMQKYSSHAVLGARGCPYNCTFCSSPAFWKRTLRQRSIENIIREIKYLINTYGKKTIALKDDTFTANPEYVRSFCKEIKKLKVKWTCLARVNTVDKKMLQLLKESNCGLIEFGVEAGNKEILKIINKMITPEQAIKVFHTCRKEGLRATAFFMIGNPHETKKTIHDSFKLALKLKPWSSSFTPSDILPGTKNYEIAQKEGILPENFSWATYVNPITGRSVPYYENPGLSEFSLKKYSKILGFALVLNKAASYSSWLDFDFLFLNPFSIMNLLPKRKGELKVITNALTRALTALDWDNKIKLILISPFLLAIIFLRGMHKLIKKGFQGNLKSKPL